MLVQLPSARAARTRALTAALALTLVTAACADDDAGDAGDLTVPPVSDVSSDTTVVDSAPTSTEATTGSTTVTTEPTTESTIATTDTTEPSAVTSTPTSEPGDTPIAASFCEAAIATQGVLTTGPEVDFETATGDEIAAALEEYGERLLPALDDLAADVPDAVADDVESLAGALRDSLESGIEPFSEPEFVEADRNIDAYMIDNCGYELASVEGVDFRFEGAPESLPAGTVGFEFVNSGSEVHEMIVFRIADDVDLSVEELLELPEDEVEGMVEFKGAAFAAPGEQDVTFVELESGRHVLLCFIPTGTTSMEMLEGEAPPEGAPHFVHGMVHEFDVA